MCFLHWQRHAMRPCALSQQSQLRPQPPNIFASRLGDPFLPDLSGRKLKQSAVHTHIAVSHGPPKWFISAYALKTHHKGVHHLEKRQVDNAEDLKSKAALALLIGRGYTKSFAKAYSLTSKEQCEANTTVQWVLKHSPVGKKLFRDSRDTRAMINSTGSTKSILHIQTKLEILKKNSLNDYRRNWCLGFHPLTHYPMLGPTFFALSPERPWQRRWGGQGACCWQWETLQPRFSHHSTWPR